MDGVFCFAGGTYIMGYVCLDANDFLNTVETDEMQLFCYLLLQCSSGNRSNVTRVERKIMMPSVLGRLCILLKGPLEGQKQAFLTWMLSDFSNLRHQKWTKTKSPDHLVVSILRAASWQQWSNTGALIQPSSSLLNEKRPHTHSHLFFFSPRLL